MRILTDLCVARDLVHSEATKGKHVSNASATDADSDGEEDSDDGSASAEPSDSPDSDSPDCHQYHQMPQYPMPQRASRPGSEKVRDAGCAVLAKYGPTTSIFSEHPYLA